MSATVYGASRFGITDDSSATGLLVGQMSTAYSADMAMVKNHIGCDVGISFYNDSSEVSCSGVVAVKATGLIPDLAAAITLANSSADSLATNSKNLFTTPVANAGLMVSAATLTRSGTEFETGDITAIFKPLIATNAPSVVS